MTIVLPARHPRLAHLMPYWKGDSLGALNIALAGRYWGIDQNGQEDAQGVVWIVHWGRMWKHGHSQSGTNALPYIARLNKDGSVMKDSRGRDLAYLDPDRFKPIYLRTTAEVDRLRSAKVGGRRLYKAAGHIQYLGKRQKAYGRKLVFCLELKHLPSIEHLRHLKAEADKAGVLLVIMRLQDLPGWEACLWRAHMAGLPTVLLARGRKPANWVTVNPWIDAVWGSWK